MKYSYQDRAGQGRAAKVMKENVGIFFPGMAGLSGWQQAKCGLRVCVCLLSARISEN